jgi:HK97 family phage prohead protease
MSENTGLSGRPPREDIFRALNMAPTLVRSEGSSMPTLTGHFAVWDQWTEINSVFEGRFMERFAPTSMNKTLAESRDSMRVLFQHGHDPQVGDKVLGSIAELEADGTGARYSVPMFDTSYNRDLIPGLDAGVYGASFRFKVVKEEFDQNAERSAYNPDGLPERTVTEARVMEFGPVTFPAYAGATAGLRSVSDEFLIGRFLDDPERLLALVEQYKNRAEPEPEVATTQPDEKPEPQATTPRANSTTFGLRNERVQVELFTTTRKETPSWRL